MTDNGTAGALPVPGGRPVRLDSTTASPFDRSDALIASDPYLSTSFGGAAAYYSLRLGQPCVSAVVVHLVLPVDAACIKLSSDRLFFTPETFADPQLVRVDCVDDRAATTTIAHKVYSLDRNYDRVHTPNVLVSTTRSGTGSFLSYSGHLSRRQASQAPTRLDLLSAALPNDGADTSIDSLDTSSSTSTLLSCTGPTNTSGGGAPSELMWHVSHLASGDHFSVVAVALPQADVLLSWGTNANGELGNSATVANPEPSPVLMVPLQRLQPGKILRVAQVACGKHHVAVVTRAAHLFTWGGNKHGQLGHGDFTARHTPCVVQFTLTTTVGSSAHRALRVKHTVERGGTNVTHVCCGAFHTLFVTHQQLILGMGYNQAGQLGLGHRLQQLKRWRSCTPAAIEALRDSSVLDIAAGQNHSACVVSNGDVFTWGCGDDGRLGTGNHESVSVPTRVAILRDARVRARTVRCGARHTAIISDRDLLYTWGANDFGQLGCGDRHARLRPSLIAFPPFVTHGVADVSLGEFHSACVAFSGEAYAWGLDLSPGNADVGQRTTPHSVEMPDNKGERVRRVSCGWSHINMSTQQTSPDDQDGGKQSTSFARKLERERLELRKEELAQWRAFTSRGVSVVPSLAKRWSHVKGRISLVDDLEVRKRVDVRCRQHDEERREALLDISGPEMSTLSITTNTMEILQLTQLVTRYVQVPIHSAIRHIEQMGGELGSRIDRYARTSPDGSVASPTALSGVFYRWTLHPPALPSPVVHPTMLSTSATMSSRVWPSPNSGLRIQPLPPSSSPRPRSGIASSTSRQSSRACRLSNALAVMDDHGEGEASQPDDKVDEIYVAQPLVMSTNSCGDSASRCISPRQLKSSSHRDPETCRSRSPSRRQRISVVDTLLHRPTFSVAQAALSPVRAQGNSERCFRPLSGR